MQLVAEILDNILEHLPAPKHQHIPRYTPQIQQTLSACLSVSRQVRHLAAERLFQTIHVDSSIDPDHLNTLLRIITPKVPWMSIRPFIRTFIYSIDPSSPSPSNHLIPLFNLLANATPESRINHFKFLISPMTDSTINNTPLANPSFESAVLRLIKLPTLHSLQIHNLNGHFFNLNRDFLLGTQVRDLGISSPSHGIGTIIDLNLESSNNDLFTTVEDLAYAHPGDDDERPTEVYYPSLESFKTDLVWPRGFSERAFDFIFRDLARLDVEINISHAFIRAESLIRKTFSTLTTLIITYNFDGYEIELPTTWTINFGDLQSLQTLEYNWLNSPSSIHQTTIVNNCRPLAGFLSLLDTIHIPMQRLSTVRWKFCYLLESLPPDVLADWLEGDARWRKLDETLGLSTLFPGLGFVCLEFCPVVFSRDFDEIVGSVLSDNRERVFPGLTASLGENFLLKAANVSNEYT